MAIVDITFDTIVAKTKKVLGKNYKEESSTEGDTTVLEDVCAMVLNEAAQWTNKTTEAKQQELMNDCWPIIVKCSCVAYLNRGSEGVGSQTELGQQNVFNDWVELLHKQLTNRRSVM